MAPPRRPGIVLGGGGLEHLNLAAVISTEYDDAITSVVSDSRASCTLCEHRAPVIGKLHRLEVEHLRCVHIFIILVPSADDEAASYMSKPPQFLVFGHNLIYL
jgi:hypothetical protein